jgi:hypothetical protein
VIDNNIGVMARGEVTVEILFDSPGHVRLPIDDDEIIDRAVAAKAFAGREVTIVTYDTGQGMRAREAELKCVKLDPGWRSEPPPRGNGLRQRNLLPEADQPRCNGRKGQQRSSAAAARHHVVSA